MKNGYYKEYYESGNPTHIMYYKNDKLHIEKGPAFIGYYESGKLRSIYYYMNNKLHRENGPAWIKYYENGNIKESFFCYKGKIIEVNLLEEYLEYVESEKLKEYLE